MYLTQATVRNIKDLLNDGSVPSSRMKGEWVKVCRDENAITEIVQGKVKGRYRLKDRNLFLNVLSRYNEAFTSEQWEELLGADQAEQSKTTGNSKLCNQDVMNGFYINTYDKFPCYIMGKHVSCLTCQDGMPGYIMDWKGFKIPSDVLVIIAENMMNVSLVRRQKYLFNTLLRNTEKHILVVAYYMPNSKTNSKALKNWLASISNRVVHFGDFDLPGINIYLTNYKPICKDRISFLIPDDIEQRIKEHGSSKRFNDHLDFVGRVDAGNDLKLKWLIDIITKYRKGYDHQGYINI